MNDEKERYKIYVRNSRILEHRVAILPFKIVELLNYRKLRLILRM